MRSRHCLLLLTVAACGRRDFNIPTDATNPDDATLAEEFPTKRSTLRLNRVTNTETLEDVPLLVTLDDTRADRTTLRADAGDLRFRDADGNALAHEIEQLGAAGGAPLQAWVRVPLVEGTSTEITVAYGGDAVPSVGTVWSDAYEGVWHMDGTGDVTDATLHVRFGAETGTGPVQGVVGGARGFDAVAQSYIRIPDGATIELPAITVSGWYFYERPSRSMSGGAAILTRQNDDGDYDDFYLGVAGDEPNASVFTDTGTTDLYSQVPLGLSMWHHIGLTWTSGTFTTYVDGVRATTGPLGGMQIHTSARPLYIGAGDNGRTNSDINLPDNEFADGAIDEVRLENVARPAGWFAFDYANQRDAVITYGPTEPVN